MRKDDINLTEAYLKIYQKQTDILEEGIFDRAKAQVSGVVKGVAPIKRLGSLAAKGLGKLAGTLSPEAGVALQKKGEELGTAASNAGLIAKVKSIMQSHSGSIMKISNEIINDLNRLELNPENMTPEQFGEQMKAQLETMLNAQLPQAAQDTSTQDTSAEEPSETQETSGETTTPAPSPTTSAAPASFSNKPASNKTKNIPIVSSVKAKTTTAKKPAAKKPAAKKPAAKKPAQTRTR